MLARCVLFLLSCTQRLCGARRAHSSPPACSAPTSPRPLLRHPRLARRHRHDVRARPARRLGRAPSQRSSRPCRQPGDQAARLLRVKVRLAARTDERRSRRRRRTTSPVSRLHPDFGDELEPSRCPGRRQGARNPLRRGASLSSFLLERASAPRLTLGHSPLQAWRRSGFLEQVSA